jgi:hypothetical protein
MTKTWEQIITENYFNLVPEERKELYSLYFNQETKDDLRKQLEKIIYYVVPPTPEEFLDSSNGWLSEAFIQSIYPWVKEEFLECTRRDKNYNKIVQYGSTRVGKTYLAILLITYTIVFIHHLREPAMYYGLSPLTDLAVYIISFKYDKTRELYLRPMFKMMEKSNRFVQVKFQDKVKSEQDRLGRDKIVYSKASTSGEITLASGLQIQLGNDDALAFIGANLLSAFISEISFWTENAGATEESIFRLYTDVSDRINATVGHDYLTYLYLDTSANNVESLIENHVLKELRYREGVRFNWITRWEALPNNGKNFPKWNKRKAELLKEKQYSSIEELYNDLYEEGYMFKVITGNGNIPAAIVEDKSQLLGIPDDFIILVPIDAYNAFKDNLIKSIKDIAGRPTQIENKFITDQSIITNIFDNHTLINFEGHLIADASDMPEKLLWNQVRDKLFYKTPRGDYQIRRAPNEPRFIALDNAFSLSGDALGITILHKEWSLEKEQSIYVHDLCCVIVGSKKEISLEAPIYFIIDLITEGSLPIYAVYADTFQSRTGKQFLERNNIQVIMQSVDRSINPYQVYLSCLMNGLIKGGRNIFWKNNLSCLMVTKSESGKDKIDHPIGTKNNKYNGDYNNSTCGLFAKDCSDTSCNAVFGAYNHQYKPSIIYEIENQRFSNALKDIYQLSTTAVKTLINSRIHY